MKKLIVLMALVCCIGVAAKGTLVAHYEFENNLTDSAGDWDGTAIGTIGYGTSYYGGNGGSKCLQLTADGDTGGNDGVLISNSGTLLNNEGSLTIALWYKAQKPATYPYYDTFVYKVSTGAGWATRFTGTQNQIAFAMTMNPAGSNTNASNTTVFDGEWHHLVFTYVSKDEYSGQDGKARCRIFVDGVQVANNYSMTSGSIVSNSDVPITIGVQPDGATYKNGIYGWIDDVRLYDSFMTTPDAVALYNATVPEPTTICILALGSLLMVNRKRK